MKVEVKELLDMFYKGEDISQYNTMSGINEQGEIVGIFVKEETLVIGVVQSNSWIRKNIYHKDGTIEEVYER